MAVKKIGRNMPCPCGSGKKYKKCCLQSMTFENHNRDDNVKDVSVIKMGQKLMSKIKKRWHDKSFRIIDSEKIDTIKMSEIIIEYADELLNYADTIEQKEKAIMLAVVAWNLGLTDKKEQEIENFLKTMKIKKQSNNWDDLFNILQGLIYKKQAQYASIKRFIVDYQFVKLDDGFHLNIASLVPPENFEYLNTD